MEKTYQPKEIEQTIYENWEKSGAFAPQGNGTPYSIILPPPNVTGHLHMGHGFQDTIMDALIRYHRMKGDNTLWQAGTDHAGIATQMVVERQLLAQGKTRHDLGREKFLEKVWEWKEHSGNTILKQMRKLGSSPDWSRLRFTMDDDLADVVRDVFIALYEEDLIYRKKRLVNWDPILHTAISDLEVVSTEETGHLWHFRYPLAGCKDKQSPENFIIIATTRPETLLGDTAVAVHPDDERYKHLVGKKIALPLTDREIPIIADDYVDPAFGTGCVKITPAHDFNDYEIGQRHNLEMINLLTFDAKMNDHTPEAYRGLDRFEARDKVVQDMKALGLLEKIENHVHKIPRGDRSKSIVEPWLTDQWYVKIAPLAEPAIEAVQKGDIKFIPDNWSKTYYQWMNNIQDWCISRQLWWGHRIPAWYDDKGQVYVGKDEADIRKKYHLTNDLVLKQDEDVLDTWFSSALWPFSTLGWPQKTRELETFYPTSVLVTGFDIIFFWVARMIMMGLKFTGQVPFKEIYITGLIRDHEGQKMSKSKGNVLDPIDLIEGVDLETLIKKRTGSLMQPEMAKSIEKATRTHFPDGIAAYGTDALRFTFCALATPTPEIKFDIARLAGYRNFCNKLWNATRYVLQNTANTEKKTDKFKFSASDRWILSLLQKTIQATIENFKTYRFDLIVQTLYDFIWHEYCDWYLELSKATLLDETIKEMHKEGARYTLVIVLETLLRLIHPMMPFISEALWQSVAPLVGRTEETIMLQPYPRYEENLTDKRSEDDITWLKNFITAIRNIRGEMDISPAKVVPILVQNGLKKDKKRIEKYLSYIKKLAKVESIIWLEKDEKAPPAATALLGKMQILLPMRGLIDKQAEITRLEKEIAKYEKDLTRIDSKLSNANFVDKAPKEIVEKEKAQLVNTKTALTQLEAKLVMIRAI